MDEPMVPAPASVGVVGISPRFSIPPAATDQAAALKSSSSSQEDWKPCNLCNYRKSIINKKHTG